MRLTLVLLSCCVAVSYQHGYIPSWPYWHPAQYLGPAHYLRPVQYYHQVPYFRPGAFQYHFQVSNSNSCSFLSMSSAFVTAVFLGRGILLFESRSFYWGFFRTCWQCQGFCSYDQRFSAGCGMLKWCLMYDVMAFERSTQ